MQNTAAAQAMAAAAAARKRALASLDNGLADSALEPGFAQLRVQAREEVRRHDTQQAELSAHNRAAHKITVEFAAWKQRFDEVDVDNSGELDIDELGELMALLGSDCTLEQLQQTMKELDTDGGGTLDWDEFKCWLQTLPTEKKRAGAIVATTGAAVTTHHTAGEQRKVVI